jgi:hypothetical protein
VPAATGDDDEQQHECGDGTEGDDQAEHEGTCRQHDLVGGLGAHRGDDPFDGVGGVAAQFGSVKGLPGMAPD